MTASKAPSSPQFPDFIVSLHHIPSLNSDLVGVLNSIGIHSVKQFLRYYPLESALTLQRWAKGEILHDITLSEFLDGDTSAIARNEILSLPLDRLREIGDRTAIIWKNAFKVETIHDLLALPAILEARSLLHHAQFQERPSAPDYLVPKPRQRSKMRNRYRSWTRTDRIHIQPGAFCPIRIKSSQKDGPAFFSFPRNATVGNTEWFVPNQCGPNTIQQFLQRTFTQIDSTIFYLGYLVTTAQDWSAQDLTLGDVSHTIGLAPGQIKRIATLQWNRFRKASRDEDTDIHETLDQDVRMHQSAEEQIHDLTIKKTRDASSEFDTSYEQKSSGTGFSVGGGAGGGGSAGADLTAALGAPLKIATSFLGSLFGGFSTNEVTSNGKQSGRIRDEVGETSKMSGRITSDINNYTKQSASNVRSLRSTVVLEDSEAEQESATTTILANYNHSHSLNIQCYELLRRYQIYTHTDTVVPIIYVPFKQICFDIQDAVALWDYLRPAVAVKAPKRMPVWDATIQLNSDLDVPPMEVNEAKISGITVISPVPFPVVLTFVIGTDPIQHEQVILNTGLNNPKFDNPFKPLDVKEVRLEVSDPSQLSISAYSSANTKRQLKITTHLTSDDGDEIRIPYVLEITVPHNLFNWLGLNQELGSAEDFSNVIEAKLSSRYAVFQANVDSLVNHLQEHELTYIRYLIATCDPADLVSVMESMVLVLGGSAISFPDIADVNSLLGITATHLIFPVRRLPQMKENKPSLGKANIRGKVGPGKLVDLEFKTDAHYAYQGDRKIIQMEFSVKNDIDQIEYQAELEVISVSSGQSTEGTLILKDTSNPERILALDLFVVMEGDQPKKGEIKGVATGEGETYNAVIGWDASLVYQPADDDIKLPEELDQIWVRAEEIKSTDLGIYDYIDLPTDGLFWEAILGQSNASEYVDPRRFTAWHEWPIPHTAPEIMPLEFGTHEASDTEGLDPTVPGSTLQQVTPSFYQPWGALSNMAGGMMSAQSPKGLGGNLLQVSSSLAQLANKAGEQASNLTGSMANTAMTQAVEFGKQIADMTNTAMTSIGSGPGGMSSGSPPTTQTEKAGALNLLDELGPDASGSLSSQGSGQDAELASAPINQEMVDRAKSEAVGVPLGGGGGAIPAGSGISGAGTDNPILISAARAALQEALDQFRSDPNFARATNVLNKAIDLQNLTGESVDSEMGEIGEHFMEISTYWLERFKTNPSSQNYLKAINARLIAQQLYDAPPFDWLEGVTRNQDGGNYAIQDGDTLSKLAQTYYDEAWRWPAIYEANVDNIGNDPGEILPIAEITIP